MKRQLLIGALVAAVAVLAVPALAQSAVWKHNGSNLNKFVELKLSGGELFETTVGNGMSCKVEATMTTEGGGTAEITKWKVVECPTGFGTFASCKFSTAEAKNLPWAVTVNATDLSVANMKIKRTFTGGCATVEKTVTTTTVALDSTTAITEMEFKGEIKEGGNQVYKSVATPLIEGAGSGTYGIG